MSAVRKKWNVLTIEQLDNHTYTHEDVLKIVEALRSGDKDTYDRIVKSPVEEPPELQEEKSGFLERVIRWGGSQTSVSSSVVWWSG